MMKWDSLKEKLFWYKEYIILLILGILAVIWLFFNFSPFSTLGHPSEKEIITKKEPTKTQKINQNNQIKLIKLKPSTQVSKISMVNPNKLKDIFTNNQINPEKFIKEYKLMFKNINNTKSRNKVVFTFYQENQIINGVKIDVTTIFSDKSELKNTDSFTLKEQQ